MSGASGRFRVWASIGGLWALVAGCRERGAPPPAGSSSPASPSASVLASATSPSTSPSAEARTVPPAPLSCLARYYAAKAVLSAGAWALELPDGTRVLWDDGKPKTLEERLAHPDVEDVFHDLYVGGPIRPVLKVDQDPGRVRIDALFRATYGETRDEVKAALVPVTLRGQTLSVHRKVADAFRRVGRRLDGVVAGNKRLDDFLHGLGGTFVWRNIAGTDRKSAHSYGVSLDINPALSHYWRSHLGPGPLEWQNDVPQAIVDAFEAEGFAWGGRWYHYDTMHFEYRPELLDPTCAPKPG